MLDWLLPLQAAVQRGEAAMLVSVVATRGSAPRNAGARMVVTRDAAFDTIGGGQLELQAIAQARAHLQQRMPIRWALHAYPLGASLGQCCGGAVELLFEPCSAADLPWLQQAVAAATGTQAAAFVRVVRLGRSGHAVCLAGAGVPVGNRWQAAGLPAQVQATLALPLPTTGAHQEALHLTLHRAPGAADAANVEAGDAWLVERHIDHRLPVALFGAGHVGNAIVRAAANLPLRLHWYDSRFAQFPTQLPANAHPHASDDVAAEVATLAPGAAYLILTHSHALDFSLVRAVLDRGDFAFLGLIGSATKRKSFAQRLRARGYGDVQLQRLTCPLGIAGIAGKQPAVIAIAVLAQLLQLPAMMSVADSADAALG